MSINNINNLPNLGNSVNSVNSGVNDGVNGVSSNAGLGTNDGASSALSKGDIDWFSSASTGKATPISAQEKFSADASLDDMVSAIVGNLGI